MRNITAGAVGGVVAGVVITGLMALGRDADLLHEALAETTQDWLDETFQTRRWAGEDGTEALEQAGHVLASAAFGALYGFLRPLTKPIPPIAAGALFGSGLYAVAVAETAPRMGSALGGADGASARRLGLHMLFGAITAIVGDALASSERARLGCRVDQRVKAIAHK